MRLEVTRKSDLAVRSLKTLEASQDRMKGPALAEAVGSSSGFVSHVLTPLVRSGWVHSEAGPSGGYSLSVDLADVSLLSVIEAIEGPTDSGRCVLADRPCSDGGICALHVPWLQARSHLLAQLEATTVADASMVPTQHPSHSPT
ncbi:MAG: Rrf2 family transcriptional regulator [Actinomycetia bacterium]|nr:Rrf2 family transcriptional regulator [Actinomycetes bacterium]MCP3910966.1 Rrf2 family transcriptional regulator [Actinomycetes bacterium]